MSERTNKREGGRSGDEEREDEEGEGESVWGSHCDNEHIHFYIAHAPIGTIDMYELYSVLYTY